MMLLFWVLIGIAIYYLCTSQENGLNPSQQQSAENKLKERYVNGEIDTEMYQHMMKTLKE
ncbi:hypothetical protein SAMN05192551_103234 [Tindallia magadiensis]|uniref:Short C-terminal domain-containing protein n=1 Tax=Tindallia magadiensis TaxID=69895 RepID=A0A1I3DBS4_9FIRM|nr:hypothetical protein [Tindallia magadiensis]SFH84210.1 hypothetical protein SAMN05192551_103234 [Tindallia magadiensis]